MLGENLLGKCAERGIGEDGAEREIGENVLRERDWGNTVLRERVWEHCAERECVCENCAEREIGKHC